METLDEMERGCKRADAYTSAVSTRLLCGKPLDLQLSKQELTVVLLRSLGLANVSSTLVNDIFEQIDEDKNGLINAAELSNFLQAEDHGRFSSFMVKRLVHTPNIGSSMFVCGSSLSIMNNLWKRSQHELEGIMLFVSYLIMWLFLIGSSLFAADFVRTTTKRLKVQGVNSLSLQLLRENLSSIEQIINLMWLFGSLAYVLASLSKYLALSSTATSGLWVIGGVIYLLGGLLALPLIYKSTSAKINRQEEMLKKINDIIESKRRRLSDVSTTNCPGQALVQHPTSRRRSLSESSMQMHLEPSHQRQNTCPVMIRVELDADTFPKEKIPRECSTESWKTIDTESLTSMSDCSLENNVCSPSYDEVYASLSTEAAVDVDTFLQALKGLYVEGQMQKSLHEQFVSKVNNLTLYREIMISPSFYIAVLYTAAGALFTIGALDIGLSQNAVQNIFLTGSFIYFCGGIFSLFKQWKAARSSWDTLVSSLGVAAIYLSRNNSLGLGNGN